MKRKNIQIVVDFSMSMKYTVGLVYVFLHQFLHYVQGRRDLSLSYQLIWFSGEAWEVVNFENGENYTESVEQLLIAMKGLYLRNGAKSNVPAIRDALAGAMENAHGEAKEQVLFFFTDYYAKELVDVTEFGKVGRVFLFVPSGQGVNYRFRIVNQVNATQKIMPTLMWSMESLREKLTVQDKECMLRLL